MITGKINGVHCSSCISLIKMDLEDIDVVDIEIEENGEFNLNDKYEDKRAEIKKVVNNLDGYELKYD